MEKKLGTGLSILDYRKSASFLIRGKWYRLKQLNSWIRFFCPEFSGLCMLSYVWAKTWRNLFFLFPLNLPDYYLFDELVCEKFCNSSVYLVWRTWTPKILSCAGEFFACIKIHKWSSCMFWWLVGALYLLQKHQNPNNGDLPFIKFSFKILWIKTISNLWGLNKYNLLG